MSATLKTTNYELPYFAEEDFVDFDAHNACMHKIDEEMKANQTAGIANADGIKNLEESVNTLGSTVNSYETRVQTLETNKDSVNEQIRVINQTDTQQNTRLTRLESDLNDIPAILADVTELRGKVSEIENVNTTQSTNIEKNKTDISSLDTRVEALEDGSGGGPTTVFAKFPYASTTNTVRELLLLDCEAEFSFVKYKAQSSGGAYKINVAYVDYMRFDFKNIGSETVRLSGANMPGIMIPGVCTSPAVLNNNTGLTAKIIKPEDSDVMRGNIIESVISENSGNISVTLTLSSREVQVEPGRHITLIIGGFLCRELQ